MSERGRKVVPKSQKQISKGMHTPYSKEAGNPNNSAYQVSNRSNQVSFKGDTVKPFTVGLEDIDSTILYYFNNVIKPSVVTNGDRIDVPLVYGSPERWKGVQQDGYFRDKEGKIQTPLIMFKRDSVEKRRDLGNKLDANSPQLYYTFQEKYSKRNQYDNFNVLQNIIPQKEFHTVVIPDYVTLQYSCIIWTDYIAQMNKLIEMINYSSESYWGDPERFKFRCYIDSFQTEAQLTDGQERLVRGSFNIRLKGQLIPEVLQKDVTALKAYNSSAQVVITQETVHGFDCKGNVIIL